jgi:membrane fusion protein, multidrug efflux system
MIPKVRPDKGRVKLPMTRANRVVFSVAGKPPEAVSHRKIGVFCALLGVLLAAGCEKKKEVVAAPAPPDVDVVAVEQRNVPIVKEWVATLNGLVNAQVRAQVSGYLLKQLYDNGAVVRKGQPLFQIDPRPYQAALDQAKAQVEQGKGKLQQAQANLQQAQARLGKTELDVKRYTPLAKENAISQQELDDAVQANLAAQGQVAAAMANIEAAKSSIVAAQAAVEGAQLNLGFTNVVSPVDGVAGINNAQVGDLVGPTTGALTAVSTINPILVLFNPSEQEYLNAARVTGDTLEKETAALRRLEFMLQLANGETYSQKGRFYAVDRQVDVKTGSISVQTEFPNPNNVLRPGGFGRLSAVVRTQEGALLVPQRAVTDSQGAYLIAVVGADNKISIRSVKPGARIGSMWVIDEGLKPGERVVAEGVQRVKQGMVVNPRPFTEDAEKAKPAA